MKHIITFVLTLSALSLQAQHQGIVVDQDTKQPVPYASIWCLSGTCGTTANEWGRFTLKEVDPTASIAITSVGYQRKELPAARLTDSIFLTKEIIVLNAVTIPKTEAATLKLGKLKNSPDEVCVANDFNNRSIGKCFSGALYQTNPCAWRKFASKPLPS